MSVSLTWAESVGAEGYRIYRGTAPLEIGSLPAPIASVLAPASAFQDNETTLEVTYYYRVAAYAGAEEAVGAQVTITDSAAPSRIALAETDLVFSIPDQLLLSGDAQTGDDLLLL